MSGAPRRLSRAWTRFARGAILTAVLGAGGPVAADIEAASYKMPTGAYGHGVLPGGEYAALEVRLTDGRVSVLDTNRSVYEDTAPRLVDLDGDGDNELLTVISYFDTGAALRIFDEIEARDHPNGTTLAIVAETPPIGRRHRWLGIVGAADLDGDGAIEIAYIDRPHLAKTLRVWRYKEGELSQIASAEGLTNHKIGWDFIAGGLRDCEEGPEMITADANWRRIMASRVTKAGITSREIGRYDGPDSLADALTCP